MDLCLTTVLLLMLQALNEVQLQDDSEFGLTWLVLETTTPGNSVGHSALDVNTDTKNQGNMTKEDMDAQLSMVNSTTFGGEETVTDSLPASSLPHNNTAGKSGTPPESLLTTTTVLLQSVSPGTISTKPRDADLPEVSNATDSSPLNTTTKSWASQEPGDAVNATGTAEPESHDNASSTIQHTPGLPQANYTSTTTLTNSTPTTLAMSTSTANSTGLSTKVIAEVSGNNTDNRGFAATDTNARKNSHAWAAILATALAVGFVAFIIYILLKKKNGRQFMHRKLVEDMPSDPVLRLDNGEPLDLKFDGLAYYNPGLQGDHIHMTNFPQGHVH